MSITANSMKEFKQIDEVMNLIFAGSFNLEESKKGVDGFYNTFSKEITVEQTGYTRYQGLGIPASLKLRSITIREEENKVVGDRHDVYVYMRGTVMLDGEEVAVAYKIPVSTANAGCNIHLSHGFVPVGEEPAEEQTEDGEPP